MMRARSWFHSTVAVGALVGLCLSATLSYAAVTADPVKVTFTSPQQSATITLTSEGTPIPESYIRGWQFLASGHDYKHMLDVEKMDGALKIGPSTTIEVGSYDLNIDTAQGAVIVRVFAPLSDLPDIVEKTAALTGLSEKEIEKRMGLTTSMGPADIQIDLPSVYYEGQTLELTMPANPGRTCAWFMNGDLVFEGPVQNALTYTVKEPGDFILTYIETEKTEGKTIAVARARAFTRVVLMPGVPTEVAVNTATLFSPPAGYRKHVWSIDGQEVSTEATLKHTFQVPGTHTVECLASAPETGPAEGFLRVRYITTVIPS